MEGDCGVVDGIKFEDKRQTLVLMYRLLPVHLVRMILHLALAVRVDCMFLYKRPLMRSIVGTFFGSLRVEGYSHLECAVVVPMSSKKDGR